VVDSEIAVKDFAKSTGKKIGAKDMIATVKFVEVTSVEGVECLRLCKDLSVKNFSAPLPVGVTVDTSEIKATMTGLYPTDATRQPISIEGMMTVIFSAKGKTPQGPSLAIDGKIEDRFESKETPLAK
jgi:hypothetical protein